MASSLTKVAVFSLLIVVVIVLDTSQKETKDLQVF